MLNDRICKLRERLNESIITGKNYKEIYDISIQLDELIAEYYEEDDLNNEENIEEKD